MASTFSSVYAANMMFLRKAPVPAQFAGISSKAMVGTVSMPTGGLGMKL